MDYEVMENVTEMVEDNTEAFTPIDCQAKEASVVGTIVKGVLFVGTIAGAIAFKKRHDIAEWVNKRRIKKLEKKGYVITRELDDEDNVHEDECQVVED